MSLKCRGIYKIIYFYNIFIILIRVEKSYGSSLKTIYPFNKILKNKLLGAV